MARQVEPDASTLGAGDMKRTPLPSHTWQQPDADGNRECEDCPTVWKAGYDDPPPWGCKREPISRGKGLSPVSETNSGREHQKDEAYREWVRRQPCVACGASPPSDAAHYKSWGSGAGDWREDGTGNLLSLCRPCHRLQHDRGIETFQQITDVDLAAKARRTGQAFREQGA